jgi:hypothetical protein
MGLGRGADVEAVKSAPFRIAGAGGQKVTIQVAQRPLFEMGSEASKLFRTFLAGAVMIARST